MYLLRNSTISVKNAVLQLVIPSRTTDNARFEIIEAQEATQYLDTFGMDCAVTHLSTPNPKVKYPLEGCLFVTFSNNTVLEDSTDIVTTVIDAYRFYKDSIDAIVQYNKNFEPVKKVLLIHEFIATLGEDYTTKLYISECEEKWITVTPVTKKKSKPI